MEGGAYYYVWSNTIKEFIHYFIYIIMTNYNLSSIVRAGLFICNRGGYKTVLIRGGKSSYYIAFFLSGLQ